MIIVGIENRAVVLCVSIDPEQLQNVREMYPECDLREQIGDENIGWSFDGATFTPPQG